MRAAPTLLLVATLLAVAACSGPVLANPPAQQPIAVAPTEPPIAVADPLPVELPRDDGPHDRLTEWWYYTGHLRDDEGGRWGFEYVIFRAERGGFPVSWASHLALTDETGDAFHYAQRAEIGPQVDDSPVDDGGEPTGFDLAIVGADPERPETFTQPPWTMAGADGTDRLAATLSATEATAAGLDGGLTLQLDLAATKPPALHDTDGWIDFGPAGGSYYYSRTAMTASGSLVLGERTLDVEGSAWFDHQWGDFIAVGGGGWDWFAVNLDDGTDLTLSLVRDADGSYPLVYGTLVDADGQSRHLLARRVHGRGHGATGRARGPARRTRPPGGSAFRARTSRSSSNRPSPTRSSTRARRPASSTGRARRTSAQPVAARRSVARHTSS